MPRRDVARTGQAQSAIKGDKAHHLGLGEMLRFAAHLPETRIAVAPDPTNQIGYLGQTTCDIGIERPASLHVEPDGVEEVAVDVKLKLPPSVIPNSDRGRAAKPGEP